MTVAVCFKCGAMKEGAFNPCERCAVMPKTEDELVLSIAMTDHHFTNAELEDMAAGIVAGKPKLLDSETRLRLIQELHSGPWLKLLKKEHNTLDGVSGARRLKPWWRYLFKKRKRDRHKVG